MEEAEQDVTDGSSTVRAPEHLTALLLLMKAFNQRPVSSLLSHFEKMASLGQPSSQPTLRQTSQRHSTVQHLENFGERQDRHNDHSSLGIHHRDNAPDITEKSHNGSPQTHLRPSLAPSARSLTPGVASRSRPVSAALGALADILPAVTVSSPQSPMSNRQHGMPSSVVDTVTERPLAAAGLIGRSMQNTHDLQNQITGPKRDPSVGAGSRSLSSGGQIKASRELLRSTGDGKSDHDTLPPPVNRTGKPRIPSKPSSFTGSSRTPTLAPPVAVQSPEERVSPFSTPPSSEGSPTVDDVPPHEALHAAPFQPPPVHYSIAEKRREQCLASSHKTPSQRPGQDMSRSWRESDTELLPGLPPRPALTELDIKDLGSIRGASAPAAMSVESSSRSTTPLKRTTPSRNKVLSNTGRNIPREQTAPRRSTDLLPSRIVNNNSSQPRDDEDDRSQPARTKMVDVTTDFPDFTETNRRKPHFKEGPLDIHTRYDTRLFDICGQYVCTSGYLTRVWDVLSGEQLTSISHGETIRVTALAFKPGGDAENEGRRLWLGTSYGDIEELDILSQNIALTKIAAHSRSEIIKIYRHKNEMWTLDDEGRLHVWPPDEDGLPNLHRNYTSFRVPKGHSFSMVIAEQLWYATGKDVRIFQPSARPESTFQILQKPLSQPGVGDITSGAVISSQLDRAYFGHNDGKVTIYSTVDYSCLGVVNVSVYKINSLAGAGVYLWAGYNTGMIYVYDTESQPWKVRKDWTAHEHPVTSILVDRSSIWKLGRLQVASLGNDSAIRIWDGMLEEDWLGRLPSRLR